jgi:hypothetical protein
VRLLSLLMRGVKPASYPVLFRHRLGAWVIQGLLVVFFLTQLGLVVIGDADALTYVAMAYFPIVLTLISRHSYSLMLRHRVDRIAELEAGQEVLK